MSAFAKQKRGHGSESRAVRLRGVGKWADSTPLFRLVAISLLLFFLSCALFVVFLGGVSPPLD